MIADKEPNGREDVASTVKDWDPEVARQRYLRNPIVKSVTQLEKSALKDKIFKRIGEMTKQWFRDNPTSSDYHYTLNGRVHTNESRLDNSLRWIATGNAIDLKNPIFTLRAKDGFRYTDRKAVVDEFLHSVAWNTKQLELLFSTEQEQAAKVASRSLAWPWPEDDAPVTGVFHYVGELDLLKRGLQLDALEKAIEAVLSRIPTRSLVPLRIEDALTREALTAEELLMFHSEHGYRPLDSDTSTGYPYYLGTWSPSEIVRRKSSSMNIVVRTAREDIVRTAEVNKRKFSNKDETIILRTQLNKRTDAKGELDLKHKSLRLVLGPEKWEAVLGKTFSVPITDVLRNQTYRVGIQPFAGFSGSKFVDATVWRMLNNSNGRLIISGDISSFDNNVSQFITMKIAERLSKCFRHEADQVAFFYHRKMLAERVCTVTPYKVYEPQPVTRISGESGTLLFNSLTVAVGMWYGHFAGAYKLIYEAAQGDDFLGVFEGATPKILEEVFAELGLEVSEDKQFVSRDAANWLQNTYTRDYPGGVYPISRALGHMMSPEKLNNVGDGEFPYMNLVRTLGQLHNTEFHPYFDNLVSFLKEYDKFKLHEKLSFDTIMSSAGQAGLEVVNDYTSEWSTRGGVPGKMQLANLAREGKDIPQPNLRYPHVYGQSVDTVAPARPIYISGIG